MSDFDTWKGDAMVIIKEFGWKRIENKPTYMRFAYTDVKEADIIVSELERYGFWVERNPLTLTVRREAP
jgi:hypothetical protein